MQQKLAEKEKAAKEENLRMLAQRAREERAGIFQEQLSKDMGDGVVDEDKVREREEIRRERQRERERDLRMSRMGTEAKAKMLARLRCFVLTFRTHGRDITEKIALGLAKPTMTRESMFDQRLFNQSEGLSTGFKDDDAYDLYDKPLFAQHLSNSIYRPKGKAESAQYGAGNEEDVEQMLSNKRFGIGSHGFQGAERQEVKL